MVMYLWRPAQNNQRYAFTPLLDDSENENDDDELFNSQIPVYDMIKHRQIESQFRDNPLLEPNVDDKLEVLCCSRRIIYSLFLGWFTMDWIEYSQ